MADQEAEMPLSITTIYYDCLERIFDFLNLEDLLNIANTCKRLQISAAAKFSHEHGNKRILIRVRDLFGRGIGIYVEQNDIVVVGAKFQLPFLRCFGAIISHLHLNFTSQPIYNTVLSQYINQYCADTLTIIGLSGYHRLAIENPFKNVETLKIWGCDFGYIFPSFDNLFPKLLHFEIRNNDFITGNVAVNFSNLEYLRIPISQWTIKSATNLLNANLQLQSLNINLIAFDFNTSRLATILKMIHAHRSISKLEVSLYPTTQVFSDELQQLAIEHPSMVELNLPCYYFTAEDVIILIGRLSTLKKFEFLVQDEFECDRMRNQLHGEWHFEQRQVCIFNPKYIIVLNRTH